MVFALCTNIGHVNIRACGPAASCVCGVLHWRISSNRGCSLGRCAVAHCRRAVHLFWLLCGRQRSLHCGFQVSIPLQLHYIHACVHHMQACGSFCWIMVKMKASTDCTACLSGNALLRLGDAFYTGMMSLLLINGTCATLRSLPKRWSHLCCHDWLAYLQVVGWNQLQSHVQA